MAVFVSRNESSDRLLGQLHPRVGQNAVLNRLSGMRPCSTLATSPAARSSNSSSASWEEKATWGVTSTLSSCSNGWSDGARGRPSRRGRRPRSPRS